MHEATFRLADDAGPSYDEITGRLGGSISLWCNDHRDLLFVDPESTDSLEPMVDAIDEFAGIADAVVDGPAVVVTETCVKTHETTAVDEVLDAHGCLLLPPIRYCDGDRIIRILALEATQLTRCYHTLQDLFSVTVAAKRDLSVRSFDRSLSGGGFAADPTLSPRQRDVLATAVGLGYYEIPRATSMESVADRIGIDRRTADEHRRQAERKVLEAFVTGGLN